MPPLRPIYGLDRLALFPAAKVIVCEGEKAADAAQRLLPDCVCVTSSGGSNGAEKTDWNPLCGRDVTIWPDADEPGHHYALSVSTAASTAGVSKVSILSPAALSAVGEQAISKGFDASDYELEKRDPDLLKAAIANAEPMQQANTAKSAESLICSDQSTAKPAEKSLRSEATADSENDWDFVIPPPVAVPEMFYGPLGDFAHSAAFGTEVNPVAAMAAAMSALSAGLGRNVGLEVGNTRHHIRFFTLHVGRTSIGRKGEAVGLLERVFKAIGCMEGGPALLPQIFDGGLSTREGLALLIHDGYTQDNVKEPAIVDKRLFVIEEEFSNVLEQAKRSGNTLSACIRGLFDGKSIKPAVRNSRAWATDPHVALHAAITPEELKEKMAKGEMTNGFANRFLTFWAERTTIEADPRPATEDEVEKLALSFMKILEFGLAGYPKQQTKINLQLSPAAKECFAHAYRRYSVRHPGGEKITSVLQRRPPMLLRMAGLFALCDLTLTISAKHIEAGIAWMDYFTASVNLIFGESSAAAAEAIRSSTSEKLLNWLSSNSGWQSRTKISTDCYSKHLKKTALDEVLTKLTLEQQIERREVDGGGTTRRTEYRLASKLR